MCTFVLHRQYVCWKTGNKNNLLTDAVVADRQQTQCSTAADNICWQTEETTIQDAGRHHTQTKR